MYLGLDLGTSALKALVVDERERCIASATWNIATLHPRQGWSEQSPANWINGVKAVLAELRARVPAELSGLKAIGLSGQMHTLVILDDAHIPFRPAILWNDVRGDDWCSKAIANQPEITSITGVKPMPSFTAAKLAWLKAAEPESFYRMRHIILPKDYVRFWLTGELATDPSDAGGTQLLDQETRSWSKKILSGLEVEEHYMPPIIAGHEIAGRLRETIAQEFGLPPVPVVCGGGDASTSAIGAGCVEAGSTMLSLGTGAVYLSMQDAFRPISNSSIHNFAHSLPNKWYHMAALLNCGSALDWVCKITGQHPTEILASIEASHRQPSRVLFLPYLDGVRTPYGNANVQGAFFGLSRAASAQDLVQAVVEGVAFALADADDALRSVGDSLQAPLLLGGGARSRFWTNLIATVFQRPLRRVAEAETGSALGAARLAMVGVRAKSMASMAPPHSEVVEPDRGMIEMYQNRLSDFRAMFSAAEDFAER